MTADALVIPAIAAMYVTMTVTVRTAAVYVTHVITAAAAMILAHAITIATATIVHLPHVIPICRE